MSRIGKKAIEIPNGVEVKVEDSKIMVKGPKGSLIRATNDNVSFDISDGAVQVNPTNKTKAAQALWGTYASLISNMVTGVTEGFSKQLIIEGVGYRAEVQGKQLVMQLGYSHPITMDIPEGLDVKVEKNIITIKGTNNEVIGQFAANVREHRKPEPYKGKGIRYSDEVVRRKEGKKSA